MMHELAKAVPAKTHYVLLRQYQIVPHKYFKDRGYEIVTEFDSGESSDMLQKRLVMDIKKKR
jgi:hypothetical protein